MNLLSSQRLKNPLPSISFMSNIPNWCLWTIWHMCIFHGFTVIWYQIGKFIKLSQNHVAWDDKKTHDYLHMGSLFVDQLTKTFLFVHNCFQFCWMLLFYILFNSDETKKKEQTPFSKDIKNYSNSQELFCFFGQNKQS